MTTFNTGDRLRRFEGAHPEVIIQRPDCSRGGTWWHARLDGHLVASDTDLGGLLDQLDRLFAGIGTRR